MAEELLIKIRSDGSAQVVGDMNKIKGAIGGTGETAKTTSSALSGMIGPLIGIGVAYKALDLSKQFVAGTIAANSFKESMLVQLKVLTKSREMAKATYEDLKKFADVTPFETKDILTAGKLLMTFGLNYKAFLRDAGDLSAAFSSSAGEMNQNILMVISAMGRIKAGQMGEAMEILRRFGVGIAVLKKEGLKFDNAGKYLGDAETFLRALKSVIKSNYGGMMEEMNKTWEGQMSNLRAHMQNILQMVGSDFFGKLKTEGMGLVDWLDKMRDNGSLQAWAKEAGTALTNVYESVKFMTDIMAKAYELSQKLTGYRAKKSEAEVSEGTSAIDQIADLKRRRDETRTGYTSAGMGSARVRTEYMVLPEKTRTELTRQIEELKKYAAKGETPIPGLGPLKDTFADSLLRANKRIEQELGVKPIITSTSELVTKHLDPKHYAELAADVANLTIEKSLGAAKIYAEEGLGVNNEYLRNSKYKTGGHLHVYQATQKELEQSSKQFEEDKNLFTGKGGGGGGGGNDPAKLLASAKKAFEKRLYDLYTKPMLYAELSASEQENILSSLTAPDEESRQKITDLMSKIFSSMVQDKITSIEEAMRAATEPIAKQMEAFAEYRASLVTKFQAVPGLPGFEVIPQGISVKDAQWQHDLERVMTEGKPSGLGAKISEYAPDAREWENVIPPSAIIKMRLDYEEYQKTQALMVTVGQETNQKRLLNEIEFWQKKLSLVAAGSSAERDEITGKVRDLQQQLEAMRNQLPDLGEEFFKSWKDGTDKATGVLDAFGNVAVNMARNIATQIQQSISNAMIQPFTQSVGNAVGGAIGSMFGGGGATVSPETTSVADAVSNTVTRKGITSEDKDLAKYQATEYVKAEEKSSGASVQTKAIPLLMPVIGTAINYLIGTLFQTQKATITQAPTVSAQPWETNEMMMLAVPGGLSGETLTEISRLNTRIQDLTNGINNNPNASAEWKRSQIEGPGGINELTAQVASLRTQFSASFDLPRSAFQQSGAGIDLAAIIAHTQEGTQATQSWYQNIAGQAQTILSNILASDAPQAWMQSAIAAGRTITQEFSARFDVGDTEAAAMWTEFLQQFQDVLYPNGQGTIVLSVTNPFTGEVIKGNTSGATTTTPSTPTTGSSTVDEVLGSITSGGTASTAAAEAKGFLSVVDSANLDAIAMRLNSDNWFDVNLVNIGEGAMAQLGAMFQAGAGGAGGAIPTGAGGGTGGAGEIQNQAGAGMAAALAAAAAASAITPEGSVNPLTVGGTNNGVPASYTVPANLTGAYNGTAYIGGVESQNAASSGMAAALIAAGMGPGSPLYEAYRAQGLPGFAKGANYIPHDMLTMVHQGEAIVPAMGVQGIEALSRGGASSGGGASHITVNITGPIQINPNSKGSLDRAVMNGVRNYSGTQNFSMALGAL
jgi:hypothetical protein